MKKYLLLLLMMLLFTYTVFAQDADETDNDSSRASAWVVTDLSLEDGDIPIITGYISFLELDDGSILEIWDGYDMLYTLDDEGLYIGETLIPVRYDYYATLDVVDEDTIKSNLISDFGFTSVESPLLYERTDIEIGIWVAIEHELIEYSLLAECMGRADAIPATLFSMPDPIVTVLIDEETNELFISNSVLFGDGVTFEVEEESEFGQLTQVITRTAIVSENVINYTYHTIADNRDDCELYYETQFIPFDGDFEGFFTQIETIIEAEDE